MNDEEIRKLIIKYIKENRRVNKAIYPSDIALAHDLDMKRVFDITEKMIEEGKLVRK